MQKSNLKLLLNLIAVSSFLFFSSCGDEDSGDPEKEVPSPVLQLVSAQAVEIEIGWAGVEDATAYEVDVALDKDFIDFLPDYNSANQTTTGVTIQNLSPSTTYFVRVRAVVADGTKSENSNVIEAKTAEAVACNDPSKYIFLEKDGVVKVEFENGEFGEGWELKTGNASTSGTGYMVWTLADFFSGPSSDLATFKLKISTPGTYKFVWNTSVTKGNSGTEHNDTWLKFPDASDFYAEKDGAKVYPKGSGKTPNPEGASKDGWFKVYRSGNDLDFKWQARTSDNDPHLIYIKFDEAKTYTMQVSARSNGHGIDKFALYLESLNEGTVTGSAEFSEVTCD